MRRIIVVALALLSAGCAVTSPPSGAGEAEQASSLLETDPHARTLYNLLVAEFAGQRGDVERAAEAYADAAADSGDPAVAERAARVAFYAGRHDLARRSAQRWQTLSPEAKEPHRVLALLALRAGDAETGYQELKASLPAESPAREQAMARIGTVVAQQAATAAAVTAVQQLAEAFPDSRMAQFVAAQVALEAERPFAALAAVNRALDLAPGWRAARLLRVDALLAAERGDDAVDELRALLDNSPEDFDLRLRLARTLVDLSRTEAALAQFERLAEQRPKDERVLYAGALLAIDAGEDARATRWLERLIATGRRADAAAYYLGRIAERNGDYELARQRYSRVGGGYNQEAQLRLAAMAADEGDVAAAMDRLRRLRENNPEAAVDAWAAQGEILRSAGRLADSVDVYTRALEAHPDNTDLLYGRAMTYVTMDRVAAAESDLRAIIARDPDNAHALNALGYTLADRTERYQEAETLIGRAYALEPRDPAIIDSMGWVAYRLGRLEEAEHYLRQAYELSPQAEIAAHLGEVLWRMGRRDEARSVWQEALKTSPDDEVLRETMERLTP